MTLFDWLKSKAGQPSKLTVFCMEELLPCPLQVVHPDRLLGALGGIPVVLNDPGTSILSLQTSMKAGSYAFKSGQGTVVAHVFERSEDDPYPGKRSSGKSYEGLGAVERNWIENAHWAVVLEVSRVTAGYKAAKLFLASVADRIASLGDGVVLDDGARRYYFPASRETSAVGTQQV